MQWFFLAIIALSLLVLISGPLATADPKALARGLRIAGGLVALGIAALLFYVGRTGFALPLAALGAMLLSRGMGAGYRFQPGNANKSAGQKSTVRTQWLEMVLDHDTGEMVGKFIRGPLAGQMFSEFNQDEIVAAFDELVGLDGQSAQLLEAYLDRHFEGWSDGRAQGEKAQGGASSAASGPMSMTEAYEILGLAAGASVADISAAHRRLMKNLHPDHGGSTFLAAKVNQAKDVAMGQK